MCSQITSDFLTWITRCLAYRTWYCLKTQCFGSVLPLAVFFYISQFYFAPRRRNTNLLFQIWGRQFSREVSRQINSWSSIKISQKMETSSIYYWKEIEWLNFLILAYNLRKFLWWLLGDAICIVITLNSFQTEYFFRE